MRDYFAALDKLSILNQKLTEQKHTEKKRIDNATKKINTLIEKLKFQQDKVIKPLIVEVKVKDKLDFKSVRGRHFYEVNPLRPA